MREAAMRKPRSGARMQPTAPAVGSREPQQSSEGATETAPDAAGDFFRPVGASPVFLITHGWRRGPHSCAASRLSSRTPRDERQRGDSSTRFLGHKKRPGGNPDSLLETHGHDRRTIVTQPEIFKTPRGVLALRVRKASACLVAIAAGFETK